MNTKSVSSRHPASPAPSPPSQRIRQRWFRAIALFLPLLFLLTLEALLRLFSYGHDTALFVRDPDNENYYVMNPDASVIYFSDTLNATKGNLERFPVIKKAGTLRLFVLGESTTAGYPYMHNGSFHRWLQYRLLHTFPDKEIEIINVSLTAVNSWTVLGFARQVLDYQPDGVLVYTGHNEYYGALGVGSTSHIGGNRRMIKMTLFLRHFRLVQVLGGLFRSTRILFSHEHIDTRENLMQRMAREQTIPYGSPDFLKGVRQFRDNMEELCRLCTDHKVPVFLSTLVCNEKDQPPFISDSSATAPAPPSTAPPSSTPAPSMIVAHPFITPPPTLPATRFPLPPTAAAFFRLGDSAYGIGQYDIAAKAYRFAKELDLLRFRAPDTLNGIIRDLCREYKTNVFLVETRSLFEEASPHGILGKETFLEHVHPNLYGYALLSDAFYRSMVAVKFISPAPGRTMPFDTLLKRMPVTVVDSLNGAWQVMMLKTRWPFHESIPARFVRGSSVEEKIAGALSVGRISWLDAMDQLFKYRLQQKDKKGALQVAEATLLEHPDNPTYLAFCGRLCFEAGYPGDGLFYFKKLYDQDNSASNTRTLFLAYIKADRPEEALALQPTGPLKTLLEEIIRLKSSLPSSTERPTLFRRLARDYRLLDAPEAAALYDSVPRVAATTPAAPR